MEDKNTQALEWAEWHYQDTLKRGFLVDIKIMETIRTALEQQSVLVGALRTLLKCSEEYIDYSEDFISESDFDLNMGLGERHAKLSVVGIPKAKQALKPFEGGGDEKV